jgi:solute carrier family 25 phosphate transporter 23/24/25/41
VRAIVSRVLREEDVLGFWRGNGAACLRVGINRGSMFLTNDIFVAALTPPDQPLSDIRRLAAGSLSGVVLVVSAYPLELAQTRLASLVGRYRGISHCLADTFAREGVRGLFAGLLPSILGVAPYVAVQFWLYDRCALNRLCFCIVFALLRGKIIDSILLPFSPG